MGRRSLEATARGEGPEDRARKGRRWLYFAAEECQGRKIKSWTKALKKSIACGLVDIQIEEGKSSAILVWPEPGVCWYSAYRIGTKAKEHDHTFKLRPRYPRCVDTAADTAGPNAGAPEPEAAAAPLKRQRGPLKCSMLIERSQKGTRRAGGGGWQLVRAMARYERATCARNGPVREGTDI